MELSSEYLTKTRRRLHALAEPSGEEYKTSEFVYGELLRFGYKPKRIKTGVYCDGGKGGRGRIALRADIDALPITENTDATGMKDCAAANGYMHACGHDGHTANLLNVARILSESRSTVPVRFIFQFDEEESGGSRTMIENGVLDGVDEIYALHLCPELERGRIGYCYGAMFAGCCEFDIRTHGRSCHCANPEDGADAVRAAVHIADGAYIAAKQAGLILNLGSISGGNARNIVADLCTGKYTLRYFDRALCEKTMLDIEKAALAADDRYGTTHDLEVVSVYEPLINNALCVDKVRSVAEGLCTEVPPRNTAEDFSFYLSEVPGCMVWLGTKERGHDKPLHSECFSFDEGALETGTELFLKLVNARA